MSFDENGDRTDLQGEWIGRVSDNKDPAGLGRVRAVVPGLFDDGSFWLEPKLVFSGDGVGVWSVPAVGARVAVSLSGGRSLERGWYTALGWFPDGDPAVTPPEESGGDPDVMVIATKRYAVVLDPRADNPTARIQDRAQGDSVTLNGRTLEVTVTATNRISLVSEGRIELRAPLVSINDRPVFPSGSEPI